MHFSPMPEQQQLGEMVQRFLSEQYGFDARRKILDSREGWSREIWSKLAELGLLSLQIPEAQGGMAPAVVETLLTATAMGKAMLLEPFLSSAILGTVLIRELGSAAQREELLPAMATGERIAVPAHFEPGAREGSGVSLSPYRTPHGVVAADVELADAPGTLIGAEGSAFAGLTAAFDQGLAAVCAEAVGALQATLDATVEYTKTRQQFGVPIARFQALQHRMADMLIHVEQARSMSYLAAMRAAEPPGHERRRALSAAKVAVGNACRFVGQQAVQLHGGMGVTDEIAVSHLFRRLTALELLLGDTAHHLEQFVAASAQAEAT